MAKIYHPKLVKISNGNKSAWYLDYQVNGKRKKKKAHSGHCDCVAKKCEHLAAANLVLRDYLNKKEIKETTGISDVTVDDFAIRYLDYSRVSGKAAASIATEEHTLRLFLAFCKMADIRNLSQVNFEVLVTFKQALQDGSVNGQRGKISPAGYNLHLRNLHLMFNHCVKIKVMEENPLKGEMARLREDEDQRKQSLSLDDIKKLADSPDTYAKDVVIFLINTGFRAGEMRNLKWSHVDLDKKRIYLTSELSYRIKDRDNKIMPLNAKALEILKKLSQEKNGQYVFGFYGVPLNTWYVNNALARLVNTLDLQGIYPDLKISPHSLRHTFATLMANQYGVAVSKISELLSHSDIRMTQRYISTPADYLVDAVDQLNELWD